MQRQQPPIKRRNGVGFLVENVLHDMNTSDNDDDYDTTNHSNKCEKYNESGENNNDKNNNDKNNNDKNKKYDEIKISIIKILKKINERKNYNHKIYNVQNVQNVQNVKNKTDATFSYINYSKIREQYRELVKVLYGEMENNKTKHRANWHIAMLCRLLAYTRDISDGCGERDLAYMQLFELARMDVKLASGLLKNLVTSQSNAQTQAQSSNKSPIGSWKDIKGLVAYMRRTMNMRDERDMTAYLGLTKYAVTFVNERLAKDVLAFYKDDNERDTATDDEEEQISFVSKWIPRENKSKKYGNFYERLACDYYKDWLPKDRNVNPISYEKAVVKCKIHYRKLVSFLNQYLETPQIKMCQQRWSDIAFSKTTRLTRDLQDRALLNLNPDDHRTKRCANNSDREACAEKYKVWKCDAINHQSGINTDLETHVRVAEYYSSCNSLAVNRNAEWAAFVSQEALKSGLSRVVPVLAGNSYKAIGLALAVAENAATGRTLILKDGNALDLHDLDASFVKNVRCLRKIVQVRGAPMYSVYSHPMYKCLISVLKLLVESNVPAKQTRNVEEPGFTVTIFADDDSSHFFNDDDASFGEVLDEVSLLYGEFGYRVPSVVLWAMESTVRNENHLHIYNSNNSNNNSSNNSNNGSNNDDDGNEMVAYSSVSHGGALTVRVGCDKNEICTYLGLEVKNKNKKEEWEREFCNNYNEWEGGWNHLVEMLYDRRYYNFEQCFWKK